MKNIQVIDGAANCVYDVFQATESEFSLIFQDGQDIAFIDEIETSAEMNSVFAKIWKRRIPKAKAIGIHGIIFYELEDKKKYYPTRNDEEAINPNGSLLR
jgi:hypothetical protein